MYRPKDLRPGDVLLMTVGDGSLPARLLDTAIAWSTANPFVHAALVGEGHLIDPVVHVERAPLHRYAQNGWAFRVAGAEAAVKSVLGWAEGRLGNPYGVEQLLADGLRFDLHIVLTPWFHWRPARWTCSGFIAAAYRQAGCALTEAPVPAPSDLSYSPLLQGPRPWGGVSRPLKRSVR